MYSKCLRGQFGDTSTQAKSPQSDSAESSGGITKDSKNGLILAAPSILYGRNKPKAEEKLAVENDAED